MPLPSSDEVQAFTIWLEALYTRLGIQEDRHTWAQSVGYWLGLYLAGQLRDGIEQAVKEAIHWTPTPPVTPPTRPSPVPRPPLPAMPHGVYDHVLPWSPPQIRDYLRADCWGVPVPTLPWMPRTSREHPERVLSWFLYKYHDHFKSDILTAHARRGYTHYYLSWPDARDDGGLSVEAFVDLCRLVKTWGFYVGVFLGAKGREFGNDIEGDPRDQTIGQWRARVRPVLDALLTTDGADEFVPAWEYDAFNRDDDTAIEYPAWIGQQAHAAGKTCWLHFRPHVTYWHPIGRYSYWQQLGASVDGLNYQGQVEWDVPLYQARLVDTLSQFGQQGNRHKLRNFEQDASAQFTRDNLTEDVVNLRSYLMCCTVDNVMHTDAKVWGFGNGARRPDGTTL